MKRDLSFNSSHTCHVCIHAIHIYPFCVSHVSQGSLNLCRRMFVSTIPSLEPKFCPPQNMPGEKVVHTDTVFTCIFRYIRLTEHVMEKRPAHLDLVY